MKKLLFTRFKIILISFLLPLNLLLSQEDGCVNDDNYIASVFNSLTECDQTVDFLMTNYNFTLEQACNWDGAGFGPGLAFPNGLGSVCECSCQPQSTSCNEGYTLLTLNYYNAAQNSFTVTNSDGDVMASYSILNGDGVLEDCFLTSDQNDCFSIDIDGGQDFTWSLSADDIVILQGGSEDFEFGPDCGCDEGYSLLTLNYYNAAQNSFTVTNSNGDVMASYSILNGDGVLEDCFLTSDQNDCFSIDIDGGQDFTWSLSADDIVILQGGSEDFEFGPDCNECSDNDALVEQYFGNFFVTECSSLITYLINNYGYSEDQACNWNGAPMADFGGMIISDFCECSCEENTSIVPNTITESNLIMIKDLMGRDISEITKNIPLLFIYNDGSIKKTIITK